MAAGIHWLTRDLRFSDNPALLAALADGPLLQVFFIDRQLKAQGSASRWRLEQGLRVHDAELRRRGGQGVLVLEGEPDALLPGLIALTGAQAVHQSDWPCPAMRAVQARVRSALSPGVALTLHGGHLLAHPNAVRTGQGGVYRVYTPFARALRQIGADRPAPAAPDRIPGYANRPAGVAVAALTLAPDMRRGAPVLATHALPAGEAAAFDRLDDFFDRARDYAADRDRPDIDATSGLSDHLATGEISPRSIWAVASLRAEADPALAPGIEKFLSEVIWREFAWHLFIDFPQMPERAWRGEWAGFPWRGANPGLTRWQRGETGAALVDAGLREMWVTGRMHNRVRMVVASWLTKHLMTDWRQGLAHFEDCLTDWDPAANAMNWQWVAGCGPDAAPFFRIFNPDRQAAQYDAAGRYRRRWLAGFDGSDAPEARAYLDAAPRRWSIAPVWKPGPGSALDEGRQSALAAYQDFRADPGEAG